MERTFTQDDRIRRAQEIYAKRKNLRDKTKRATVNVSKPKNLKLFKKLVLQIVICILIYYIFYLINTTNYSFSSDTLSKTKEIVSHDFDFLSIYNKLIDDINKFLYSEENKSEEQNNLEGNEENKEGEENKDNIVQEDLGNVQIKEDEESVNQSEVSYTEESETERIRRNYSFILPVNFGKISSEYGTREVTSSVVTAYHKGIDIAADVGTAIFSSTNGEVLISRYSPSYGNYVMIQNNEVKTVYAHCSELLVSVGDTIFQGQEIAKVGATGDVTGSHLHFEIRINDTCIDPRLMLEFEGVKEG